MCLYAAIWQYVKDRPGHNRRYAIDSRKTVQRYLDNPQCVADVQSGAYREWVSKQYATRQS